MCIGQTYGYYLMSYTYHKGVVQSVGQVKLFQGHLTAFLHLCFVFSVLSILYLVGSTCAASLKLHLNAQVPVLVELIVTSYHKTGNGDGVTLEVAISLSSTIKAVNAIVLELSQNLAITTNAVTGIRVHFCRIVVPLGVGETN